MRRIWLGSCALATSGQAMAVLPRSATKSRLVIAARRPKDQDPYGIKLTHEALAIEQTAQTLKRVMNCPERASGDTSVPPPFSDMTDGAPNVARWPIYYLARCGKNHHLTASSA
jgi:hypothetical protein